MSVFSSQEIRKIAVRERIPGAEGTFGGKSIPPHAYQNAMQQWEAISSDDPESSSESKGRRAPGKVAGLLWKPIGPDGMSDGTSIVNGRIGSIAVDPKNPRVIYLGATDGGVWKKVNAGKTWTPLTDHEPMIAMGDPNAIAIDPNHTNTIYAGTASFLKGEEGEGSQGTQPNTTIGILKSNNGGHKWIILGSGVPSWNNGNASQFAGQNIYSIAVDPANSDNLYLAASSGLYYSTDAGENWAQGAGSGVDQAGNLELDTSSPPASRVLFAGVSKTGILRSTNGGAAWTRVLDGATLAVAGQLAAHSHAKIGKISVSLAPAAGDPAGVQVVYASIDGTGGDFPINGSPYTNILGIFETTDQGATWSFNGTGPTGPKGVCQCGATNNIAVDPGSPGDGVHDIVYWGGTDTWKSSDSGVTFADITNGMHVDSRSWAFSPGTPTVVYAGNDGGIWRSTDGGTTWTGTAAGSPTLNAGGLQTGLIYHMDIKRDARAGVTLGAFLDNGQGQWTGKPMWLHTLGGDGSEVVFDQQALATAYAIENEGPIISTDDGATWSSMVNDLPPGQIAHFDNTLSVDPNSSGVVYFGGGADGTTPGQLFRTLDFGMHWNKITKFTQVADVGPSAVSPANSNNVAVAVGANLFISADGLAVKPTFTQISGTPGSQITRLAFDPHNANALYFVTSGFVPAGHVFRVNFTVSAGQVTAGTVTDVSPALNVPFDGLALDGTTNPTTIYAGSDLGVLRSANGGATWTTLDPRHFPNAVVTDLQLNPAANVLRASTFGRGVFEMRLRHGPHLRH